MSNNRFENIAEVFSIIEKYNLIINRVNYISETIGKLYCKHLRRRNGGCYDYKFDSVDVKLVNDKINIILPYDGEYVLNIDYYLSVREILLRDKEIVENFKRWSDSQLTDLENLPNLEENDL